MKKSLSECIEVCNGGIKPVLTEENLNYVMQSVKELEKKMGSEESLSVDDVKGLYSDEHILSIWSDEAYTPEKGEGFYRFEDFLIDFIEQNMQIDCY